MDKIISAKGIVKTYGKTGARVLNGVDVEIGSGEFTALMGPSGSGKSTLLFALSGMDGVTEGMVTFDGASLQNLSENDLADIRRRRMGFVFQQPTMLKNLNILDNIILPATKGKNKKKAEAVKTAMELMKRTGISGLEDRDITEVSGGQLQRAGICRALINRPAVLFADEPTGALNSKTSDEIMELLSGINKEGTAIVLVTHDAKVAARADRVLFTSDGVVTAEIRFEKDTDLAARTGMISARMGEAGV